MGHYMGRPEPEPDPDAERDIVLALIAGRLAAIEAHEVDIFETLADLSGRLRAVENEGTAK